MSLVELLKKELRVATSLKAQTPWFRIAKWVVILAVGRWMWGHTYFWPVVLGAIAVSVALHLFWRSKTKGWTQPWGGWDDV